MSDVGPSRAAIALLSFALVAGCAPASGGGDDESGGEANSVASREESTGGTPGETVNTLTEEEAADGFTLLFDGATLEHWRGFRRDDVPGGWSAVDGALAFTPDVDGGDIITRGTYGDFDLRLEWKIGPGGNSGVFFGVTEDAERTYESGPEMQVLDNSGHPDGQNPLTSAGANYGIDAPSADVTRPIGEWNEARVLRHGNHIEHWLNGVRVVEYEIGSTEWKAKVAETKFAEWPDYGIHREGHIGLQDHGNPVWYRHLRIRPR